MRLSDKVFHALGYRVVWGEPDSEGVYTPTVYYSAAPTSGAPTTILHVDG